MGVYDTFWAEHDGKPISVQSKRFACHLADYQIGDGVSLSAVKSERHHDAVYCVVEDIYPALADGTTLWVGLLICDGDYSDYVVRTTEADAETAGQQLVVAWRLPEVRAGRLAVHQRQLVAQRNTLQIRLSRIRGLLNDYYHWLYERENPPPDNIKQSKVLQKLFGPQRSYAKEPLDRWVAEELKSYEGELKTENELDVDYYFDLLKKRRGKSVAKAKDSGKER